MWLSRRNGRPRLSTTEELTTSAEYPSSLAPSTVFIDLINCKTQNLIEALRFTPYYSTIVLLSCLLLQSKHYQNCHLLESFLPHLHPTLGGTSPHSDQHRDSSLFMLSSSPTPSHPSPTSSPIGRTKRKRIVEGSCWPCKQRRIKCDLQKPYCRRCLQAGANNCSYDRICIRWKKTPQKANTDLQTLQPKIERALNDISLAINERRALDYFQGRLWPLFSTVDQPCQPPVALALRSQPVLQALCVFAEEHRALQERGAAQHTLENRRLHCLALVRGQLGENKNGVDALSPLLVAVLLLYFNDGYLNCTKPDASTQLHFAGVLALVDALGGFEAAYRASDRMTRMLMSEMASTDLTDALLHSRRPNFPARVWDIMEPGSVWWETAAGTPSLGSVLRILSGMSAYQSDIQDGAEPNNEEVRAFERALQPSYTMMDYEWASPTSDKTVPTSEQFDPTTTACLSLIRAFQHAGLIYLYSALLKVPCHHYLIQQHVQACLECVLGMETKSRVQNCALFPLYVAGAHSITDAHRKYVLERLDIIYANLGFQSVSSIRKTLTDLWESDEAATVWEDMYQKANGCALVI